MEGNKDEAQRCLGIARRHLDSENYASARKFCLKSIALFETPDATKLLELINRAEGLSTSKANGSGEPSSSNSTTEEHPSAAGMKHRHTQPKANGNGTAGGMGGEKREYTAEQANLVKRVRSCKVTEYYEILAVKKDCDDAEIEKAYRKVGFRICLTLLLAQSRNCHSLLWLHILTRTAHRVRTKRSSVSTSHSHHKRSELLSAISSGIKSFPSTLRYGTFLRINEIPAQLN